MFENASNLELSLSVHEYKIKVYVYSAHSIGIASLKEVLEDICTYYL